MKPIIAIIALTAALWIAVLAAAICIALLADAWTQVHAAKDPPPTFIFTRSADFDRDGCISLDEINQVVAHFGQTLETPGYERKYNVQVRFILYPGLTFQQLLLNASAIDKGDILEAVAQYKEEPC